jgi:hypothetical protein
MWTSAGFKSIMPCVTVLHHTLCTNQTLLRVMDELSCQVGVVCEFTRTVQMVFCQVNLIVNRFCKLVKMDC